MSKIGKFKKRHGDCEQWSNEEGLWLLRQLHRTQFDIDDYGSVVALHVLDMASTAVEHSYQDVNNTLFVDEYGHWSDDAFCTEQGPWNDTFVNKLLDHMAHIAFALRDMHHHGLPPETLARLQRVSDTLESGMKEKPFALLRGRAREACGLPLPNDGGVQ